MAPHLRKKAFRWNAFLRHIMALCRSAQFSLPVDAIIARETLSRLMQWLGFLELVTRLASYKNISISFGEAQASLAGLPIPQLVQWTNPPPPESRGLAGLPIPQLVQFERELVNDNLSLAGLPIPQLVQFLHLLNEHGLGLAGLPIPQLVQWRDRRMARAVRLAGLPIPQLVQ